MMLTPCVVQVLHGGQERFGFGGGEGTGRLIEDQNARVLRQGLGDLDQLLLGEGQIC